MQRSREELDALLMAAHAAGAQEELVTLYREAGEASEDRGEIDPACFYYTHAYVFALECGDPRAAALLAKLVSHGRDAMPA